MAELKATLNYHDGFQGTYEVGGQTIHISREGVHPYDMTFGAIASCCYSTMLDWCREKKVTVGDVQVVVTGEKRTEIPAFLTWVNLDFTVESPDSEEAVRECVEGALQDCSMVQMTAKVAKISYTLKVHE